MVYHRIVHLKLTMLFNQCRANESNKKINKIKCPFHCLHNLYFHLENEAYYPETVIISEIVRFSKERVIMLFLNKTLLNT